MVHNSETVITSEPNSTPVIAAHHPDNASATGRSGLLVVSTPSDAKVLQSASHYAKVKKLACATTWTTGACAMGLMFSPFYLPGLSGIAGLGAAVAAITFCGVPSGIAAAIAGTAGRHQEQAKRAEDEERARLEIARRAQAEADALEALLY